MPPQTPQPQQHMANVATLAPIVPTPRGVSSPAPLILCPVDIISRVGRTGISIMLIPKRVSVSSLSLRMDHVGGPLHI